MLTGQAPLADAPRLAVQDFDPFDIPMPVVAPGVAPEDAFAELDTDNNGIIKGEEFAAIPKSDKFNKVTREEMVRSSVFYRYCEHNVRERVACTGVDTAASCVLGTVWCGLDSGR